MYQRVLVGLVGLVGLGALVGCGGEAADAPAISVTDPSGAPAAQVELASTNVGQSSAAMLYVANDGRAPLGPIALAISGPSANDFVLDNALTSCAGATLAPGAGCEIAIVFRPTADGDRTATLAVTAPGDAASVALLGHAVMPSLHFVPAAIDFGQLEIGRGGQTTFELRNDGTAAAPIQSLTVSGAGFARGLATCGATLGPGASCDVIVRAAPQALGALAGSLVVSSGGQGYAAGLAARGARRLTAVVAGAGAIASTSGGIDCGSTCTGLFETDVLLTATPAANAQIVGWSIPACGQSPTCNVAADLVPETVTATFALVGSSAINVVFAGDAPGEVLVQLQGQPSAIPCYASCTVPAMPGQGVEIYAATPWVFGGLSGGCAAADGYCTLTAPVGAASVTAMFTKDPKDQWTRLLGGAVWAAVFDSTEALVVGGSGGVVKLSPAGATVWSVGLAAVSLATGPADSIYVNTGTHVVKLNAAGVTQWTQPLDANSAGCPAAAFVHCIAVAPDGAVAVPGTSGVSRWDASGAPTWSKPLGGASMHGIAIDLAGVVMVAQLSAISGEEADAVRFTAGGAPLSTLEDVSPQYHGMITTDAAGNLVTSSSGHSNAYLRAYTATPIAKSIAVPVASFVENGVAPTGTGELAWLHYLTDASGATDWKVTRYTQAGGEGWTLTRLRTFNLVYGPTGTQPMDLAGSPTGRIAIVGQFHGLTSTSGWVQSYVP